MGKKSGQKSKSYKIHEKYDDSRYEIIKIRPKSKKNHSGLPSVALIPKVYSCHFCGLTGSNYRECRICQITLVCPDHYNNLNCGEICAEGKITPNSLCYTSCIAGYIKEWYSQERSIELCEKACNTKLKNTSQDRMVRKFLIEAHIYVGQLDEAMESYEKYINGQFTLAFGELTLLVISIRKWVQVERFVKKNPQTVEEKAELEFEAFEEVLDNFEIHTVQSFLKRNQPAMDLIKKHLQYDWRVKYYKNQTLRAQERVRFWQLNDKYLHSCKRDDINWAIQDMIYNRHDDETFKNFLRDYYD